MQSYGVMISLILSVSKRTDIPAYYSYWFMDKIKQGKVAYRNPKFANMVYELPLNSDVVDCIVFWTKDPTIMFNNGNFDTLKRYGYKFYFELTVNAYDESIEPNLTSKKSIIAAIQQMSDSLGKICIDLRYDPIFIDSLHTVEWHKNQYRMLLHELGHYCSKSIISFIDNMGRNKISHFKSPTEDEKISLCEAFVNTAKKYNLTVNTCAENLSKELIDIGVVPNACIDSDKISNILNYRLKVAKSGSRQACNCVNNIDIEEYNTCKTGCAYCYAADKMTTDCNNIVESLLLNGDFKPNDIVTKKELNSLLKR